jgi:NADH-quinone oxidoreductase subunit J
MTPPEMTSILFILLSVTCVGSVLAMLLSRRQTYAALFLVLAFAALGGIFGLLDAPFVAAAQVLIYAGAIMVLFVFVIMMIDPRQSPPSERKAWFLPAAVTLSTALLLEIVWAARGSFARLARTLGRPSSPADIGRLLFSQYLYPFEIASLLILAALIGAVVLSRRKDAA